MPRRTTDVKQKRPAHTMRLDSIARDTGTVVKFLRTENGWDWHISNESGPLFQGCAPDCYIWLQGFARGLEVARKEFSDER